MFHFTEEENEGDPNSGISAIPHNASKDCLMAIIKENPPTITRKASTPLKFHKTFPRTTKIKETMAFIVFP